ncbi:MAG: amidase family protein [Thermoleophilia bacterium]|jgi:aspartyl-tRNA(Asn)/glutamyl-tRNA(Gln) amidotransferase subunit A
MDPIFVYQESQIALKSQTTLKTTAGGTPGPDAGGTCASAGGEEPLRGIRVAVQPNISVRGWPTEAGSHALAGFTALEDATVVRHLRAAGVSLVGSTHTSEFGLGLEGSRAGAALQQGRADVELVLDLAGEARLAAAEAGVYALKPSFGLVSRFGLVGLIPSMEACAILSVDPRRVGDVLNVIAGPDELDLSLPDDAAVDLGSQTVDPATVTVGVITEALAGLTAEQVQGFRASLETWRRLGVTVREVSLPSFPLFSLVHQIVGSVEASSCAGRYDSVRYGPRAPGAKNWNEMYLLSRGAAFGTALKSYLIQGAFFQFERYEAFESACRIRRRVVEEMDRLTAETDFLVLPVSGPAGTADLTSSADFAGGAAAGLSGLSGLSGLGSTSNNLYARSALTLCANVTGQPALYLPPGPGTTAGGLQLLGPRLADGRLLAFAGLLLNALSHEAVGRDKTAGGATSTRGGMAGGVIAEGGE